MRPKVSHIAGPDCEPAAAESEYHCSVEWHLFHIPSAPAIYSWAHKVSGKSGSFYASARNMAAYFRADRGTILRALKALTANGFLILDRAERGRSNVYRVIDHKDWALAHPGLCVQELAFPWKGEGDPLGPRLYAISGGRAKFFPSQMTGLRNHCGLSDDEISEQFQRFLLEWDYTGSAWNRIYYDFCEYLTTSDVLHRSSHPPSRVAAPKQPPVAAPKQPYSSNIFSDAKSNSTIPAEAAALRSSTFLVPEAKPSQEVDLEQRKRTQKDALARWVKSQKVQSA
jgi:hypothetical protein